MPINRQDRVNHWRSLAADVLAAATDATDPAVHATAHCHCGAVRRPCDQGRNHRAHGFDTATDLALGNEVRTIGAIPPIVNAAATRMERPPKRLLLRRPPVAPPVGRRS